MRGWLKAIRLESNIKQDVIIEKCDISRTYYGMLESGKRNPSVNVAKALGELLGFEWTRFFDEVHDADLLVNSNL